MPIPHKPPPPVILVEEVEDLLARGRRRLEVQGFNPEGYSQEFTWQKTDISSSVGGAVTVSRIVLGGDVRALCGWSLAETTNAAPAAVRFHDGNNANTEIFVRVNLAINESTRDFLVPHGMECQTGRVFIEVVSGSVEGVIYWR